MIFCSLGSGSKGNCTFVKDSGPALLIDQGFSLKSLSQRMAIVGLEPRQVGAIILTHEHNDHLRGIGSFARRFQVPVYLTTMTYRSIPADFLRHAEIRLYTVGDELQIHDLRVKTFHIPHDAADPIAVVITGNRHRVGIITDIGSGAQYLREYLTNLDLLLLESNHDITMLDNGPYPLWLIKRIKSRVGHLSNVQAITLFRELALDGRLRHLVLGHLSEQNNTPEIVGRLFQEAVRQITPAIQLNIANQHVPGPLIEL
jgi:phosphoribosyl 1,2-cyclic phosphodiesterase